MSHLENAKKWLVGISNTAGQTMQYFKTTDHRVYEIFKAGPLLKTTPSINFFCQNNINITIQSLIALTVENLKPQPNNISPQ